MDKNAILNRLSNMRVKDIVMMILRGTFSFDEIKESGQLDEEKLELVARTLSVALEEKRRFDERLQSLMERAEKLLEERQELQDSRFFEYPRKLYERLEEEKYSIIADSNRLEEEIRCSEFCNDDRIFPSVSMGTVLGSISLPEKRSRQAMQGYPLEGESDRRTFYDEDTIMVKAEFKGPFYREKPKDLHRLPLPKTWRFWQRKADSVYSALYAPASAGVDKWFKVQVHLYGKSDAKRVNKKALAMDGNATLNESNPLSINIERGTKVEAEIHVYDEGVRVNTMKQSLVWHGEMVSTVFQVKANNSTLKSVAGDVTLSVKGFPVGRLSFNTEITQSLTDESTFVLGKAKSYKKAFISYSHADIKSAEMAASFLKGLGLDYFFDRQSLAPGAVFDEEIKRNIRESDLFILLWSENAAKSEYVEKEYLYALPLAYPQEPREKATLEFLPYFIEPHADAPEKLKSIYNFSKMHLN